MTSKAPSELGSSGARSSRRSPKSQSAVRSRAQAVPTPKGAPVIRVWVRDTHSAFTADSWLSRGCCAQHVHICPSGNAVVSAPGTAGLSLQQRPGWRPATTEAQAAGSGQGGVAVDRAGLSGPAVPGRACTGGRDGPDEWTGRENNSRIVLCRDCPARLRRWSGWQPGRASDEMETDSVPAHAEFIEGSLPLGVGVGGPATCAAGRSPASRPLLVAASIHDGLRKRGPIRSRVGPGPLARLDCPSPPAAMDSRMPYARMRRATRRRFTHTSVIAGRL